MDIRAFLKNEVKPALGCTEPVAVALAAATAAALIPQTIYRIQLRVSSNIFKNGVRVGIPGGEGLKGNAMAAALGALTGDAAAGLKVLAGVTPEAVETAKKLLEAGAVSQEIVPGSPPVYVEAHVESRDAEGATHTATAVIMGRHDRVVERRVDGRSLEEDTDAHPGGGHEGAQPAYVRDLLCADMARLFALADLAAATAYAAERDFLLEGATMNRAMARAGLSRPMGLGVGHAMLAQEGDVSQLAEEEPLVVPGMSGSRLGFRIKAVTAAAADARMAGAPLPVMSSAGSGNHGLAAILPPTLAAEAWGKSETELAQALLLSHLVTSFVKAHTGVLTPICGCAVAAGLGAASALVKLGGGSPRQAEAACAALLGSLLGMVCDGAKGSCALKVGVAAGEAATAALLALSGLGAEEGATHTPQGAVPTSLPAMARMVGKLSNTGFAATDAVLIDCMREAEAEG